MANPGALSTANLIPTFQTAASSANVDLTTAVVTDITGATLTFSVPVACTGLAFAFADIDCTAFVASTVGTVRIVLDGTELVRANAQFNSANDRTTTGTLTPLTLTAGSHTLKVQGNNSTASGTLRYIIANTTLAVIVFGA